MRGKGYTSLECQGCSRITPAYAGKRWTIALSISITSDHPRACGEKSIRCIAKDRSVGSPPRMRGKEADERHKGQAHGITPAHAGKRSFITDKVLRSRDHPRACGEKDSGHARGRKVQGSPPRMRGKGPQDGCFQAGGRITPAHAGKSLQASCRPSTRRDHPRACGEKKVMRGGKDKRMGSPPRMRGKGRSFELPVAVDRITPAHAGKSCNCFGRCDCGQDHPRACGEKKIR